MGKVINFSKNILLGSIFVLPLLGAFGGLGYEQIKVLFFLLSTSLITLLSWEKQFKWTLLSKVAGAWVLILMLTSMTGINSQGSLLGKDPYFQGWISYLYLFPFYLIVKEAKIELENYALVLSGSAAIVSLLAIKDWILFNIFQQPIPNYAGRVVSTFGQPNFYAGFLLFTLPFAYFLLRVSDKRLQYFAMAGGLISMTAILVSYSRTAILLMLLLLILGLVVELKIKLKLILIIIGVVLVSILTALKFSSGIVGNEVSQPAATNNPDLTKDSVEKRAYLWPLAWQIFWQRPIFGYGLENISLTFSKYFEINKHQLFEENLKIYPVFISLKDLNIDRTHNYILDLLLFSGILGLFSWLVLVVLLFKKLIRKLRQKSHGRSNNVLLFISLLIYLIWIQVQNQSMVQLVYFWLLAGLIDQESSESL